MHLIIAGDKQDLGFLIDHLLFLEHSIAVISDNKEWLSSLEDRHEIVTVEGYPWHGPTLKKAGVEEAEIFLAVTPYEDRNIFSCQVARHFRVPRAIARITSSLEDIGLSSEEFIGALGDTKFIHFEKLCAQEFTKIVTSSTLRETMVLRAFQSVISSIVIPEGYFIREKIEDIQSDEMKKCQFIALKRGIKTIIPRGKDHFEEGDEVYFICQELDLEEILTWLRVPKSTIKKVVLTGDTNIIWHTARILERSKEMKIEVVVPNYNLARQYANQLESASVIYGNIGDSRIRDEVQLLESDLFISMFEQESDSIMNSVLAKTHLVKKVFTLFNKVQTKNLLTKMLKVDYSLSRTQMISQALLSKILSSLNKTPILFADLEVELLEVSISKSSPLIRKDIEHLGLPPGVFIAALVRQNRSIFPRGKDTIEYADRLLIVYENRLKAKVLEIFA